MSIVKGSSIKSQNKLTGKIRPGELVAEYTIKSVSFISFAVIILIFVFVFREALPVFYSDNKPKKEIITQSETYGDVVPDNNSKEIQKQNQNLSSSETGGSEGKATWKNIISN